MGKAARLKAQEQAVRALAKLPASYCAAAQLIYPKYFRPDCCINGSRIALEIFRRNGRDAVAVATQVLAMNQPMWKHVQVNGVSGQWTPELEAAGAWMVGIDGSGSMEGIGYSAHVIVVVDGFLIDSSAGQMSRPLKGMEIPWTVAAPVDKDFLKGGTATINQGDAVLLYKTLPDERGFMTASGWNWHRENFGVASEIAAVMEAKKRWATK